MKSAVFTGDVDGIDPYGTLAEYVKVIDTVAAIRTPEDRIQARHVLRRMIIGFPPHISPAAFIKNEHAELALTDEERRIQEQDTIDRKAKQEAIDADIASGTYPWQAHARHNEESRVNTHLIGFYGDEALQPLYGPPYFESTHGQKEVHLIHLDIKPVEGEVRKSAHWDALPEDLREQFEGGSIPITGTTDLYALTDEELDNLAVSEDPFKMQKHIKKKLAQADDGYYVLYYSDFRNPGGRTGVLMQSRDGDMQPVTTKIGDDEFLIEAKSIGTKYGGFGGKHRRQSGNDVITGGGTARESVREIERLEETEFHDGPQPVGAITFRNEEGEDQGVLLRLTPSTVRAAFTMPDAYPKIDSPDIAKRVFDMYTQLLADQTLGENPYIIGAQSSHTENILIWKDTYGYTDSADKAAFHDGSVVSYEKDFKLRTPKEFLIEYIGLVGYIPGRSKVEKQYFIDGLTRAFASHGKNIDLHPEDYDFEIAEKLWAEGGIAYSVFKARRERGFVADGVLKDFTDYAAKVRDIFGEKAMGSEESFKQRMEDMVATVKKQLLEKRNKTSDIDAQREINSILAELGGNNFLNGSNGYDLISNTFSQNHGETQEDNELIQNAEDIKTIQQLFFIHELYFDHESDVVSGALKSCPEEERENVEDAKAEVGRKLDEAFILRTPEGLYRALTDAEYVRELITMEVYSQGSELSTDIEAHPEQVIFDPRQYGSSTEFFLADAQIDWAGIEDPDPGSQRTL